jgi:predicted N-acetyltransferase YhbS
MGIRKFKKSDIAEVSSLIRKTFLEFNIKETTMKGAKDYMEQMSISNPGLIERYSKGISYVYCEGGKILGVVRAKDDMVKNLFVEGRHHRKSIGTKLMDKAESGIWKNGVKAIKIRASMYAVPFYLRRGYKKTTGVRTFHGLKIQPMIKRRGI